MIFFPKELSAERNSLILRNMADNYLEKRMEDLRAGRLSCNAAPASSPIAQKGWLRIKFPRRRVLVIDFGDLSSTLSIAKEFADADCKVAVASSESDLINLSGAVRKYRYSPCDGSADRQIVRDLISVWRDIDVVTVVAPTDLNDKNIGTFNSKIDDLLDEWCLFREKSPIKSEYGGRLIFISRQPNTHLTKENGKAIHLIDGNLSALLKRLSISSAVLSFSTPEINPRAILLLCSPAFNGVQAYDGFC